MVSRKHQLAIVAGLWSAGSATASEIYSFDEVVVSATRSEQELGDIAASVGVIKRDEMAASLNQNLKTAIDAEPGVSMAGNGRFGFTGVNIRGRDQNYVKTMIDGVELPVSYDPGANVMRKYNNSIETDTLQQVEINKGPVSSLYGSDALAGAVIIRTTDPADVLPAGDAGYAAVKTGYYSADSSYKATATFANRVDNLETLLIYTHRGGHELKTYGGPDSLGPDRGAADPLNFRSNNLLAKAFYQASAAHRFGIAIELFDREQQVEVLSEEGKSISSPTMGQYDYTNIKAQDEDSRARYSIEHQWQANNMAFDKLNWQLAYLKSQSSHDNTDTLTKSVTTGEVVTQSVQNRNRQRIGSDEAWQADLQFNKAIDIGNSAHEWVYGASFVHNAFNLNYNNIDLGTGSVVNATPEIPNAQARKWGLFAQDQIFMLNDALVLNAGLRYDNFKAEPTGNSSYTGAQNDAITGRIGAVYHWTDTFSSFAQVSQGFKAPTLQDLYYFYNSGATFIPNPELQAEQSLSYETGLRLQSAFGRLDVAVFYNDYKNFIEDRLVTANGPDGKEVWTTENIGRAEIFGAELKAQLGLQALGAPQGWYSNLSLAYAKGKNKADGAAIDSVAPLTAQLGLGYQHPSAVFGTELALRAVAGKANGDWSNANGVNNVTAPGYSQTDLTAFYRPLNGLTLRAGVFNLLDKKYWNYADLAGFDTSDSGLERLTQPGRNWGIEAEYQF